MKIVLLKAFLSVPICFLFNLNLSLSRTLHNLIYLPFYGILYIVVP